MTNLISHTFPKEEKLCSQKLMDEMFRTGHSFLMYPLRVVWKQVEEFPVESPAQAGFSVAKRLFKHAVSRNRLKRMLRESYRLQKHLLFDRLIQANVHIALMFVYIAKEELPYAKIEPAVMRAIGRINSEIKPGQV